MIALSDEEMGIIMASAAPIPIVDRAKFLRAVADRLAEFSGALGRETYWDAAYKKTPSPTPVIAVESESESETNLNHSQ